jgi:putative ABC transport system permease protein
VLAVIVALLGVVNTLFAAVIDRTRELGILRALGTSLGQIVVTVLCEAVLLALCAAILGLIGGGCFAYLFVTFVNVQGTGWRIGFHPPAAYQLGLVLVTLIAAAAAAGWPAYRAARLKLSQALAYE